MRAATTQERQEPLSIIKTSCKRSRTKQPVMLQQLLERAESRLREIESMRLTQRKLQPKNL